MAREVDDSVAMMIKVVAAMSVMVMVGAAGSASAEVTSPNSAALPARVPDTSAVEVNPGIAVALSLGGTVASYALIAAGRDHGSVVAVGALGTLIMPSVGRWYAHSAGLGGLAIRGAGIASAVVGAATVFSACPLFSSESECNHSDVNLGVALVILGGLAYAGGTIYDIFAASQDAVRYNARLHDARLHDVALVPVINPERHGYGMVLSARF